tara:strand:+ start:117 stop:347 length:231 start_codon:yes stop_codon:yes gene_type:complete
MKNILTMAGAAALVAGQSVSAAAATDTAARTASPVSTSEKIGGGSEVWLVLGFAVLAAAIVFLVEENEDDETPASP